MNCVQITDRDIFAAKARGRRVEIVSVVDAVPRLQNGWRATVRTVYTCEFHDETNGPTRWVFIEVSLVDERGNATVAGPDSLWAKLVEDPTADLHVVKRAGSLV